MWWNLLFLTSTWTGAVPAWQQRPGPIDAVRQATVMVEVLGPRGRATGSGFVVARDGTIATAAHVLEGAWLVRVKLASGEFLPVIGVRDIDRRLDIAFLATPAAGLKPVELGDSDSLRIGQRLLALGCPFGLEVSVADGLLGAIQSHDGLRILQISIPVSPGSSGGPVFTEDGKVVGLVVSGMRERGAENINFALPFNYLRERLAAALERSPVPLTSLPRPDFATWEAAENTADAGPLAPVNQSLTLGFAQVHGAEVLTRWKRSDGVVLTSLVKVGLSQTPSGDTIVEQVRETRATHWAGGELGREVHRTVLRRGGQNLFSASVEFKAVAGQAEDSGSMLESRGDQYVISEMRGTQRTGRSPRGILPPSLVDLVVAAQPGPLPRRLEFLVLDPVHERMVTARFEFTGRIRRKVPLAKPGTTCEGRPQVANTEVELLVGVREVGLERKPVVVMATAPYLVLEDQVKCVRLPESRGLFAGPP